MQYDMDTHETIVMSVGGSLIVPDQIDTEFLSGLKKFIEEETAAGRRFIIITGGGKTSRRYIDAADELAKLEDEDLDWLGIHTTRLNAHLLRTIFRDIAHPVIVTNPDDILDMPKDAPLIIGAGYRPGSSSDLQAVRIADRVGAKKMINLSNIDYVYTADPRTNKDAEKIESISWAKFRTLIPEEWDPGLSSPFDPVAAKRAQDGGIEVAVINGHRMDALTDYLHGEAFVGTKIS